MTGRVTTSSGNGGRPVPWRSTFARNLKQAYALTVGFLLAGSVPVLAVRCISTLNARRSAGGDGGKARLVAFSYAQLGPPPSLAAEPERVGGFGAGIPVPPNAGVPEPVVDSTAVAETAPTQAELAGGSPLSGTGTGGFFIGDRLPPSAVYLSYLRVEVKPEPVSIPNLEFPKNFRRRGFEDATVVVNSLVDTDGSIRSVEVVQSSGSPVLDTAAAKAALASRFTPARYRDRTVKVWVSIPFRFGSD